jgi:hypothetical protein
MSVPDGHAMRSLSSKKILHLSDAGNWLYNSNRHLTFTPYKELASQSKWTKAGEANWQRVTDVLEHMKCDWLINGDKSLLLSRQERQQKAECYLTTLPLLISLQPSHLPYNGHIWASDGSMIPAASGLGDAKSITAAITSPETLVLQLNGHNLSILHGELIGLIMGLILSLTGTGNMVLHTDHMNSVHFIDDSRTAINQDSWLRNMDGRSYYRWISDLIQ